MHLYIFNLYMHLNIYKYGLIWSCILVYVGIMRLTGSQDLFTSHSHPGSWCTLHQANTVTVQCHPTSLWRAVVPAELPWHMVIKLNKHQFK